MIFGQRKDGAEDSIVSEGLKEAINSYLFMTEECEDCCQLWDTWLEDECLNDFGFLMPWYGLKHFTET